MKNFVVVTTILLVAVIFSTCTNTWAVDVYGKRFSPPHIYFAHSSLSKSGVTSGIKGQDNFLVLQFTSIDKDKGEWTPEGFSYTVLIPAFLNILDKEEHGLNVTEIKWEGELYKKIEKALEPKTVETALLSAANGTNDYLWYQVDDKVQIPSAPQKIQVTLNYKGQECYTDTSLLKIYEKLDTPPAVSPEYFKFWLHRGPHYRNGKWDELADYLKKSGINAIQFTLSLPPDQDAECMKEMWKRGFYIIAQQWGSYESIYKDNLFGCLTQGPQWFEKFDGGSMKYYLPFSDAALWDFESDVSSFTSDMLDKLTTEQFKKICNIPADKEMTKEVIRAEYLKEWIDFRQNQLALCVKHWAEFIRSINPETETIVTEGWVHRFDSSQQIDYAKYGKYVTYCDPMNFAEPSSLQTMKKWMRRAPCVQFTGCQNVNAGSYSNVFIPARSIMLQILGAVLIGCKGTSIYSGTGMDAENFVLFNRVMGFLGRNQDLIFEGTPEPVNVILKPLPKEDVEMDLGDGTKIRNTYPDWELDSTIRSYHNSGLNEYMVVVNNYNSKEPCYLKLTMTLPQGKWLIADDENRKVFTFNGEREISSSLFGKAIYLKCPAYDYHGFRIKPASDITKEAVKTYMPVNLEAAEKEALSYAQ